MRDPASEQAGILNVDPPLPARADLRLNGPDAIQLREHGLDVTFQVRPFFESALLRPRAMLRGPLVSPYPHAKRHALHARKDRADIASDLRFPILELARLLRATQDGLQGFEASINIGAQYREHLLREYPGYFRVVRRHSKPFWEGNASTWIVASKFRTAANEIETSCCNARGAAEPHAGAPTLALASRSELAPLAPDLHP